MSIPGAGQRRKPADRSSRAASSTIWASSLS